MKHFLIIISLLITNYAFCCTCGSYQSVNEAFEKADKVVIGTILNKEPIIRIDSVEYKRLINKGINETQARRFTSGGYYQYTLLLSESSYKGTFASDTIHIQTGLTSGSCGYSFQLGEKYIVYGYNRDTVPNESVDKHDQFWTNNCTRTNLFDIREQKNLAKIIRRKKKKSH